MSSSPLRAGRPAVSGMLGGLIGLIAGVAIDGALWLWAFGKALDHDAATSIPFLVTTNPEHGDVSATAEIGMLVLPLALMVACASAGVLIALIGQRRERQEGLASP